MKKTIAKHTLGLIGTVILWFILNQGLDEWSRTNWHGDIERDGGFLLLIMLISYIVVCLIYWAVKTIWFDKDKDSQKGD